MQRVLLFLAAALAAGIVPHLAEAQTRSVPEPRLNGFWNIDADDRSDQLFKTHAELTPAGQEIARQNAERQRERTAHGEVVGLGAYTCGRSGVPGVLNTSEPWLLLVTPDEAQQLTERREIPPRHFYLDGRTWPDMKTLPQSVQGYSIAHWEGKTLVIETRGTPSGNLPKGGIKGPSTVTTERISVDAKGDRLTWTYSWNDPGLLAKPLVLSLHYDRAPPHTFAYTHPCDPNMDSARTVGDPAQ